MEKRYTAIAVANYFLSKYGHTGIQPLKLQKLVYIAHGWHLALRGKKQPLVFDENAEAWQYGPVFPSVYHEFKDRGKQPITDLGTEFVAKETGNIGSIVSVTPEIKQKDENTTNLLDRVWEVYGRWSGIQLSTLCHQPGTPWDITRKKSNGRRNAHIENEIIYKHYKKKLEQNVSKNAK
ncbi:MAG: type II toxin-antitoxin system antitoxin SocA domain-containing protein [Parvularculales bacterium]